MSQEIAIKLFENHKIRTHWDEKQEKWHLSVVDIIAVLTSSEYQKARNYWKVLKHRLLEEGNEMTHAVGTFLNKVERFLNYTIWRNHPHKKDFEHDLVLRLSSFKENAGMIGRSLSYGLLLFSLGLCATLIYLLLSMI